MSQPKSRVVEAELRRVIRVLQAAGLPIVRVVVGPAGTIVETAERAEPVTTPKRRIEL